MCLRFADRSVWTPPNRMSCSSEGMWLPEICVGGRKNVLFSHVGNKWRSKSARYLVCCGSSCLIVTTASLIPHRPIGEHFRGAVNPATQPQVLPAHHLQRSVPHQLVIRRYGLPEWDHWRLHGSFNKTKYSRMTSMGYFRIQMMFAGLYIFEGLLPNRTLMYVLENPFRAFMRIPNLSYALNK